MFPQAICASGSEKLTMHGLALTEGQISSFHGRISVAKALANRIRQRLGTWLLKGSLPMFLRAGDSITLDPLVNGHWEPILTEFFRTVARSGFDGFLLDIGANVGLTACQCGDFFKQVFMFEPNPEIFPILELNAKLMLRSCQRHAYNIGLGPVSARSILNVPSHNWGGAFVHDRFNAYSDALLATKHLVRDLSTANYRQMEIQIEPAGEVCAALFAHLARLGLKRGVIKLDTEGYEKAILESLAPHLPRDFAVVVVFENWDPDLALAELVARFGRPTAVFCLSRRPRQRGALWRDLPFMIPLGGVHFTLEPFAGEACDGDFVLIVGEHTPQTAS